MPTIYDYVVVVRGTDSDGEVKDYEYRGGAYTVSDAVAQAVIELDTAHGLTSRGDEVKLISVGPDREAGKAEAKKFIDAMQTVFRGPKGPQ